MFVDLWRFEVMLDLNGIMGDMGGKQGGLSPAHREMKRADLRTKSLCERAAVHGEEIKDRGQFQYLEGVADLGGDAKRAQRQGAHKLQLSGWRGDEPDTSMCLRDREGAGTLKSSDDRGAQLHPDEPLRDGVSPLLWTTVEVGEAAWIKEKTPLVCSVWFHAGGEVVEREKNMAKEVCALLRVDGRGPQCREDSSRSRIAHADVHVFLGGGSIERENRSLRSIFCDDSDGAVAP